MSDLADYEGCFKGVRLTREDGVLEISIHKDGGPAEWGSREDGLHNQLGLAFAEIARDPENKVVILTGTGDSFCARMDTSLPRPDAGTPLGFDRIFREGLALLNNLLEIPVPVIGVVNGPALIHAELVLLSDIVIASDTAVFADAAHVQFGVVPGDGVHVIWPMLLGPNRGRYFLLTGEQVPALEAQRLGLVGEVLPPEKLKARAWEIARGLAVKPELMLRHTRRLLTHPFKRRLLDELGYGLSLEGMAIIRPG